jgi:hypothetical protein
MDGTPPAAFGAGQRARRVGSLRDGHAEANRILWDNTQAQSQLICDLEAELVLLRRQIKVADGRPDASCRVLS